MNNNFVRFKDLFYTISIKNKNPNVLLLAATQDRGIIPKKDVGYRTVTISEENYDGLKVVSKGDFCITLRSFQGGIEYSDYDGAISSGYTILRLKQKASHMFFKYYLKNIEFIASLNKYKISIRDGQNIPFSSLGDELIKIPSFLEQTAIANYLDTETSKIDRKISILEQKHEKLEEYKRSVIFETVTKGLDNNVPMKDSGIDWIGEIPKHWEVKRVKDVSKIKKGKAVETYLEKSDEMLPCIDTNFLRGRDNIVFCKNGTKINSEKVLILWDGANAGELFFNKEIGYLGSTFGVFNTNINNKYWFYYLKGIEQYSRDNLTGMGIPHVDGTVLKQTIGLVPPKQEQEKIASFLDSETSKINKKKENIAKRIELLKEYKQSLIYEAVTGKLDIE